MASSGVMDLFEEKIELTVVNSWSASEGAQGDRLDDSLRITSVKIV
jgi:hypothetical protein